MPKGALVGLANAGRDASANHRRHGRHRVMLAAKLYSVHGETSAVLLDLSQSGAMLSASPPLPPGCKVALVRLALETDGKVVWTNGNRFGVEFDESLDEGLVDHLVSRSPVESAH